MIDIKCTFNTMLDTSSLKYHPKNRNKHSVEQIKRLAKLIEYQGFRHPVIISSISNYIIAGHGRVEAAKQLGMEKVPCDIQEFKDVDQEYAFLISDNSISSWAEFNLSEINTDLADLGPDFDIDLLGIKDFVLEPAEFIEPPLKGEPKDKETEMMTCPNCGILIEKCNG